MIVDELEGCPSVPVVDLVRDDQLAVAVQGRPGPHVAGALRGHPRPLDVLLLRVAEGPDFVTLDAAGADIADGGVVLGRAGPPGVHLQLHDGI